MTAIHELRDDFTRRLAVRLKGRTPAELVEQRSAAWVEAIVETLREAGKARGLDVAPIRRGVGDIGWELAWGRNLSLDYARLSRTPPADAFALELVAEVSEGTFMPSQKGERAVEEAASDLARLLWTRAPLKVLAFGARVDDDSAAALAALDAGLGGVLAARDKDSDYLLVAVASLGATNVAPPERAHLWTKVVAKGRGEAPVTTPFAKLGA